MVVEEQHHPVVQEHQEVQEVEVIPFLVLVVQELPAKVTVAETLDLLVREIMVVQVVAEQAEPVLMLLGLIWVQLVDQV